MKQRKKVKEKKRKKECKMSQFKDYLNKVRIDESKKDDKEVISKKNKKAIELKDLFSGYSYITVDGKSLHDLLKTKKNVQDFNKEKIRKENIEQQVVEIIKNSKVIYYGTEQKATASKEKIEKLMINNNIDIKKLKPLPQKTI